MQRYQCLRTLLVIGAVSIAALSAPATAHAVQAQVTVTCLTSSGTVSKTFPLSGNLTSATTFVDLRTASPAGDGVYPYDSTSSCRFKIVGTAQFTKDAAKVGQLFLNNLSIRNVGTNRGTATIFYQQVNTAADPTTVQCVSLSADGFFYAGSTFPTGDGFDLTMRVDYFKSGSLYQRFFLGRGLTLPTTATATNTGCPSTSGAQITTSPLGVLDFTVVNDAFFNPQNPQQIFNRIPACTGCTKGTTATSGARISKQFDVDLSPGHEISSIATLRGGMAEQASNNGAKEQQRQAAANQLLQAIAIGDSARMDLKPGQSVNFILLTSDAGNIVADLFGGPCEEVDQPCFDITQVDADGLRLFAGVSGLEENTIPEFHDENGGAPIVHYVYGDFNKDGYTDLRGQWSQKDLLIFPGDDRVQIRGTILVNGEPTPFTAEDSAVTQQ